MKHNRRNILILFFSLIVVMIGFGAMIPVMPFYVESFGASGSALGLLMTTYAVMQFIFAPLWGALSDRYGRKPIIIVGMLGNTIAQLIFGLSTSLWMLFVARALAGILSSATLPTAMAYVSDSTSEEDRGGGMGIMGAAMGIGMVLGPGIGGALGQMSLAMPFLADAALSFVALLLILALLPESLPQEARSQAAGWKGPQLGEMWRALFSPIGVLLVLAFLLSFGMTNFESVFGLYTLERYGYGPERVGMIMMSLGVVSALAQGGLTGPLSRRWGEAAIIRGSLLLSAIGFVLMLGAENFAGVMATATVFMLGNAMLRPATASLISKRTPIAQGMAMGLNNSFMSLGRIVGPTWAGFIFDQNMSYPYLSGAIIMLIGFVISVIWLSGKAPVGVTEPAREAELSG